MTIPKTAALQIHPDRLSEIELQAGFQGIRTRARPARLIKGGTLPMISTACAGHGSILEPFALKRMNEMNETLAYVATSRPRYDAQVFTDDAGQLGKALSRSHENATALASEQIQSYAMGMQRMPLKNIVPFLQAGQMPF